MQLRDNEKKVSVMKAAKLERRKVMTSWLAHSVQEKITAVIILPTRIMTWLSELQFRTLQTAIIISIATSYYVMKNIHVHLVQDCSKLFHLV
jgi:hypothetical protein